jgi:hypothetical protein
MITEQASEPVVIVEGVAGSIGTLALMVLVPVALVSFVVISFFRGMVLHLVQALRFP